jgi:abhydrolase domain-containing protein 5
MTYEFGDQNKDTLVMIHGYAGTALNFFRTFRLLEPEYHVYAIDLLGKGSSSRPEFLAKDREEAEEFFISSLEKWREAVGVTNFTLIGHSMGGYISAKYTLKYPEHVQSLILWSPLGIQPGPENIKSYFKAYMK